jgi:hypothetical protein
MHRFRFLGLLSVSLIAAAALMACGGGDDDDGGSSGDGGSSSFSSGTGSDKEYVEDICKAGSKFAEDLQKATQNITAAQATDEKKLAEVMEKPFANFVEALKDAKPPSDLKDWHADAVKQLQAILTAIKSGDFEALENNDEPFPEPPAGAAERLQKIAADNDDCQDAEIDFSGE